MARRGILPHRASAGARVDAQHVIDAIAGPGLDTRIWASAGYLSDDAFYDQQSQMWFAPVVLTPSQLGPVNCRLGGFIAGSGIAIYAPLHKGDEVLVTLGEGNPNAGPTVVARQNSPVALPPMASDWDNASLVIYTQGANTPIRLIADLVTVGNHQKITQDPDNKGIIGSKFRNSQSTMDSSLQQQFASLQSALQELQAALVTASTSIAGFTCAAPGDPVVGAVAAGAAIAEAAAAAGSAATAAQNLEQAVETFENDASSNNSFLSDSFKLGL